MNEGLEKQLMDWWQFSFWLAIRYPKEFKKYVTEFKKECIREL